MSANTFGRYSLGQVLPGRPHRVRRRRRAGAGESRRQSQSVKNQSLRLRRRQRALVDRCWRTSGSAGSSTRSTCCPSTSAPRRRPTPASPVSTSTTTFSFGTAGRVRRGRPHGFNFGSGLGVNRCNCPLDQDETQWQLVGNITKLLGNHNFKAGVDIRRANNLRVPSDAHRSGELTFSQNRTIGPNGGGLGLATFLLGDVTRLRRYVSPNTDAREQQWRTAYYAQDTWRTERQVDAELWPAARHHQSADRERSRERWLPRSRDRRNPGRGRRRHRAERRHREPAELGAPGRRDLSDRQQDRPARRLRPQLRPRRVRIALRPQRDAEPAGAVGAGAQRARRISSACSRWRRDRPRRCSRRSRRTAGSHCPMAYSRARFRRSSGRRPSMRST